MAWRAINLANWVHQIFLSVREYISGNAENAWDGSGFVEEVEDDGGPGNRRDSMPLNSENEDDNDETVADGTRPVVNIHLPSNTGTVVIGDNSTVTYVDNVGVASREKEKNENARSLAHSKSNPLEEEAQVVNLDKINNRRKPRRKKKPACEKDNTPSKVPSVAKRIDEIDKSLSKFRGNGEWIAHSDAIEKFMNEYKRDEDNADIILLLKYERAAALCEKNELEMSRKLVTEVAKEINGGERSNWDQISDIKKMIYCKCLFLISKIYCVKRNFGRAYNALERASSLSQHNNVQLESHLYLAYAYYQCCLNQVQCTANSVNHVIEYTEKSQDISSTLRDRFQREEIRREILVMRCRAIIQFYLDNGNGEEFSTVLSTSLEELEGQLWNGISLRQKIDVHLMKSNYFELQGNLAKTLDHVQEALRIAQKCEFNKDVLLLSDRIRKHQKFPEEPVNDSEGLVKKVLEIQTTTDGNVESNAAENTDRGIFSTDESDWDLLKQDGCLLLQQIEGNEAEVDILEEI